MKRFAVAAFLALTAATGLSGCGFTPLYAAPGIVNHLAAIDVVAPEGRTGFLMRENLNDAFAHNPSVPATYKMQLALGEARYPRGVRIDNVASRYEYVLTATYQLINIPAGTLAKRGTVRVELTYDSADQPYASIAAQQNASERATVEASKRIQLELAAWLANGGAKPKG